jgi:hypothetical protein
MLLGLEVQRLYASGITRRSKLRLDSTCIFSEQLFDLCELVVKLQTFFVRQCVRRLDDLARYDLLDREFDFLEVDRCLCTYQSVNTLPEPVQ